MSLDEEGYKHVSHARGVDGDGPAADGAVDLSIIVCLGGCECSQRLR